MSGGGLAESARSGPALTVTRRPECWDIWEAQGGQAVDIVPAQGRLWAHWEAGQCGQSCVADLLHAREPTGGIAGPAAMTCPPWRAVALCWTQWGRCSASKPTPGALTIESASTKALKNTRTCARRWRGDIPTILGP